MDEKYNKYYNIIVDCIIETLNKGYNDELDYIYFDLTKNKQIQTILRDAEGLDALLFSTFKDILENYRKRVKTMQTLYYKIDKTTIEILEEIKIKDGGE